MRKVWLTSARARETDKKRRAEELAEHRHEEEIFREAQRLNRLEEITRLQQAQSNREYQTGLWLTLISKKNLEIGLENLGQFLHDISSSGLKPDLLERLSYLIRLAGSDVTSYEEIEEKVKLIMIGEAKDELRRKLSGNSYQEYFASLIGFDSSA